MRRLLRVYKTGELDDDGVTPVWRWECEHYECMYRTTDHGVSLYWETAIKAANRHIKWHQDRRPRAQI